MRVAAHGSRGDDRVQEATDVRQAAVSEQRNVCADIDGGELGGQQGRPQGGPPHRQGNVDAGVQPGWGEGMEKQKMWTLDRGRKRTGIIEVWKKLEWHAGEHSNKNVDLGSDQVKEYSTETSKTTRGNKARVQDST